MLGRTTVLGFLPSASAINLILYFATFGHKFGIVHLGLDVFMVAISLWSVEKTLILARLGLFLPRIRYCISGVI